MFVLIGGFWWLCLFIAYWQVFGFFGLFALFAWSICCGGQVRCGGCNGVVALCLSVWWCLLVVFLYCE